jgi:hypothetical protein
MSLRNIQIGYDLLPSHHITFKKRGLLMLPKISKLLKGHSMLVQAAIAVVCSRRSTIFRANGEIRGSQNGRPQINRIEILFNH